VTALARKRRLLILGGTTEARELSALTVERLGERLHVITSLAGRTETPSRPAGEVRRGGFGGASGLAAYLRAEAVDYLVDATHPFARRISRHAVAAAEASGIPVLALVRPPWRLSAGDRWIEVADAAAAAAVLPGLARRVWLTVGGDELAAFAAVPDAWFLVRRIEPPASPLPLRAFKLILGRGPFVVEDERRLIAEHRIEALVCRASGGAATEAKLVAARDAGLPVVMIRRPAPASQSTAETPAAALAWLIQRLDA
jgi:precorrin-6A/cobalt-precorrin-6A reductase